MAESKSSPEDRITVEKTISFLGQELRKAQYKEKIKGQLIKKMIKEKREYRKAVDMIKHRIISELDKDPTAFRDIREHLGLDDEKKDDPENWM